MMLLLRALVILGAVLAVLSCQNAFAAEVGGEGDAFVGAADESCSTTLSSSWGSVPAAGGTLTNSGAGYCW